MDKRRTTAIEVGNLRTRFGLSMKEAHAKRRQILSSGLTVDQFLASPNPLAGVHDAGPLASDPVKMMEAAGNLFKLAGGVQKAKEAVDMYGKLSATEE